jgi:hypothetical protein
MNRMTVSVSVLLGLSVLMNVGLLVRGRDREPEEAAVRKAAPTRSAPAVVEPPRLLPAPATPLPEATSQARPISDAPPPAPALVVMPSRIDPRVARILDEEEEFKAFWHDLGRVFGIQEKLDSEEYERVVVSSTADFLKFQEPARSQFFSQTRAALTERVQARKEYDDAKKTLPPKDKNNPALYTAARQPLDTRFQARMKTGEDRVAALLDLSQVRHQEFAAKLQKWLKELEPMAP